jgi:hypothetical protein
MGPDGYLEERGLVVLAPEALAEVQAAVTAGTTMAAPEK